MGRRLIEVYPARALVLGGATMLALFGVVAFIFRRVDVANDQLSVVGGFFAYGFIAFAALVGLLAWRGKDVRDAHTVADRFLADHATVGRTIGKPVDVRLRPARTARSANGARLTIPAEVGGPLAEGTAEAIVEREGEQWRVVGGDLEVDDHHFALVAD
ncbi:MAG: hypothetical protein OEM67_08490 [Thermoleophilia bacterium]|nr:hypothetical protein [Thermoleophilia bacterium]MDH3725600.1 hypothetical protein [Thermoleophilia bacterium]